MTIYKVDVEVAGRPLTMHVKAGILATMEVGTITDGAETPTYKIVAIADQSADGASAWVQTSKFDGVSDVRVLHEGWISSGRLKSTGSSSDAAASVVVEESPSDAMLACQEKASFGMLACCTDSGDGCYVRCCGGCCSDPVGCPGATCCP